MLLPSMLLTKKRSMRAHAWSASRAEATYDATAGALWKILLKEKGLQQSGVTSLQGCICSFCVTHRLWNMAVQPANTMLKE